MVNNEEDKVVLCTNVNGNVEEKAIDCFGVDINVAEVLGCIAVDGIIVANFEVVGKMLDRTVPCFDTDDITEVLVANFDAEKVELWLDFEGNVEVTLASHFEVDCLEGRPLLLDLLSAHSGFVANRLAGGLLVAMQSSDAELSF